MSASAGEDLMLAQIADSALPVPETEYRFHPPRRWRFDFAWPELAVALEVEGGTFSAGRHTHPIGYENDCEKYSQAAIDGWCVVRATSRMVRDRRALDLLRSALDAAAPLRDIPKAA